MGFSTKSRLIDKAIAGIESGEFKNYSDAAKALKIDRTSIAKRRKMQTRPKNVFLSESHQCLTTAQEN